MRQATSVDGTTAGRDEDGDGPPLLLVHGEPRAAGVEAFAR